MLSMLLIRQSEAKGVNRSDWDESENGIAAACFPVRVTCSNSWRAGGSCCVWRDRELAPLSQHLHRAGCKPLS